MCLCKYYLPCIVCNFALQSVFPVQSTNVGSRSIYLQPLEIAAVNAGDFTDTLNIAARHQIGCFMKAFAASGALVRLQPIRVRSGAFSASRGWCQAASHEVLLFDSASLLRTPPGTPQGPGLGWTTLAYSPCIIRATPNVNLHRREFPSEKLGASIVCKKCLTWNVSE